MSMNLGNGLTPQQLQPAQIWTQGASATQWTAPEPPKPKPVMPPPLFQERAASEAALVLSGMAFLLLSTVILLWQWKPQFILVVLLWGGTAVGMWFVRRHELNIRKRQYMADVLASQ